MNIITIQSGVMTAWQMPEEPTMLPLSCNVNCEGNCGDVCPEIQGNRLENEHQKQAYKNRVKQARASAIPVSEESKEKVRDLIYKTQRVKITDGKASFFKLEEGKDYPLDVEFKKRKEWIDKESPLSTWSSIPFHDNKSPRILSREVAVLVEPKTKIKEQFDWMTKEKAERLSKPGKLSDQSVSVKEETQDWKTEFMVVLKDGIKFSNQVGDYVVSQSNFRLD